MNKWFRNVFSIMLAVVMLFSVAIIPASADPEEKTEIKNVIIMIPDGGGFGNFDMADAVKRTGTGVEGTRTQFTTDAISGKTSEGLYLFDYLIGTSKTNSLYMDDSQYGSGATDSAAGGTAIATGNKTVNFAVSLNHSSGMPYASILEACQMEGKACGMITTSYWYDATPGAFASHAAERHYMDKISTQILNHDLDILLGGSAPISYSKTLQTTKAKDLGYTLVSNTTELMDAVDSGVDKIWSNFSSEYEKSMDYDCDESDEPTIKEMTQAAIKHLTENAESENGFCLMVEGGQVDHGAHDSDAVHVVTEYLAFDEAFAYAVNWAMNDGHTIVVAVPDHDTGGLDAIDEAAAIADLQNRIDPDGTKIKWNRPGSHTPQNVGIWLYAPDDVRTDIIEAMGLPTTGSPENVRSGKYHSGVEFNEDYAIENSSIMPGVAQALGIDLKTATKELFYDITKTGTYDSDAGIFTTENGIKIPNFSNYYIKADGTKVYFDYGISYYNDYMRRFMVPKAVADELSWENPFIDVEEGKWFYDAVKYVNMAGLMGGQNQDDTFEPMTSMNRAMLVTVLWRAEGSPAPEAPADFTDLTGNYYKDAVAWAVENDITNGTGNGKFEPNLALTRETIATLLSRYAEFKGITSDANGDLTIFPDGSTVSGWAKTGMEWAVANNIIGGKQAGDDVILAPKVNSNRAEVATMLMRFNSAFGK